MWTKFFIVFTILSLWFLSNPRVQVLAITPPDFPACTNPQGTLTAQYTAGVHGVVGNTSEFQGEDKVYIVNDNQVTQCLCTVDKQGIQTNWWKASSISDADIKILKSLGWLFVPTGAVWGLTDVSYMAKNINYDCGGGVGGGVLGISTGEVLGLATTGSGALVLSVFGAGTVLILLGFILRKKNS